MNKHHLGADLLSGHFYPNTLSWSSDPLAMAEQGELQTIQKHVCMRVCVHFGQGWLESGVVSIDILVLLLLQCNAAKPHYHAPLWHSRIPFEWHVDSEWVEADSAVQAVRKTESRRHPFSLVEENVSVWQMAFALNA